jgi:pimeloyl-ACP methyl ester carboxylesterase
MSAPEPGNAPAAKAVATTTAGLRGSVWNPARLPPDTQVSVHSLRTYDGANVTGFLFRRGGEKTVCCSMHPREMVVTNYLVPDMLMAGVAMWVQGPRSVGNDIRLEHETAVLDLAAGQRFLRGEGFEKTVLVGISGGAALAVMYSQQAEAKPADRIKRSPAGRPVGLDEAELPAPNGFVLVSPHLGQGKLLQNCIDPAVIDERDPLQSNDDISAFNPKNGWKRAPESSSYSPEFLARYRQAQRERVARIDAFALEAVKRRMDARRRAKEKPNREDGILGAYAPIFQVWRTDADPRCFDLSLEPTDRAYGTLWGAKPTASNYGSVGFARVCTPESWLSNWSANHSNASMEKCAPSLTKPLLMIEYTGDNSVFPSEADAIFGYVGSQDKTRVRILGNHQGQPIRPGDPSGQIEAGQRITAWLSEKGLR